MQKPKVLLQVILIYILTGVNNVPDCRVLFLLMLPTLLPVVKSYG